MNNLGPRANLKFLLHVNISDLLLGQQYISYKGLNSNASGDDGTMNYLEILWVLLLVHIVSSLNAILEKKINRINVAPSVRTSVNNLVPLSFQIRAHTDF